MKLVVNKTHKLMGNITIPGSKSHSIRALMIALLAEGKTEISNLLLADDTLAAKNICRMLNPNITEQDDKLMINNTGSIISSPNCQLNSGNSGITTAFILPLLGLRQNPHEPIVLDCHEQMRARPIQPLITALGNLGMTIESINNDDRLPISISGTLTGGNTEVEGTNSQYLSALLLSLPCAELDSEIRVQHLQERPYVEMTLHWLKQYRINYQHKREGEWDVYHIPGRQQYIAQAVAIPGDYSSASYALTANCLLSSDVCMQGLLASDCQGDKRLISILKSMGAAITIDNDDMYIKGGKALQGIKIDAGDIPDLLPVLAVLGTQAKGRTDIVNVAHARIKETDRIESMADGLQRLGAKVEIHADGLTIWQSELTGSAVRGYADHRTVMAMSIAGMLAAGTTTIDTAEAINKTYPSYVTDMQQLGADMVLQKHIILIGCKGVGKSTIARALAEKLDKQLIDLDMLIEDLYQKHNNITEQQSTCREIYQKHGEVYFRELETNALSQALKSSAAVIALGGGALESEKNRELIKAQQLIHITADYEAVYARVSQAGVPAYYQDDKSFADNFNNTWLSRNKICQQIATLSVANNENVAATVMNIITQLED